MKRYPPGARPVLKMLGLIVEPRILYRPFFFEVCFVLTPADPTVKRMRRIHG